jgi:hypothetical protein
LFDRAQAQERDQASIWTPELVCKTGVDSADQKFRELRCVCGDIDIRHQGGNADTSWSALNSSITFRSFTSFARAAGSSSSMSLMSSTLS